MTRLRMLSAAIFSIVSIITISSLLTTTSAANVDVAWDNSGSTIALEDSVWMPMEMDAMAAVNTMPRMAAMTDRELFDLQSTLTGLPPIQPPPPEIGLNLVSQTPPVLYYCRPTEIPGVSIVLFPNDTDALNALGNVHLILDGVHGAIVFTVTDGVTFVGDPAGAIHLELTGSLGALNGVLASMLFSPDSNFFGYASINWQLSNDGTSRIPLTNGTLSIVVGSISIVPILVPLAPDGKLAGFTMNEKTTSPSFPGVAVSDGSGTGQTIYKVTIQSYEGTLNLATEVGLTELAKSKGLIEFNALPDKLNAAFATFTFTSDAYGAFGGNAGFVISVTNTFHKTSGFIQASITNRPNAPQPVNGALPAPAITAITATSATATWQATPNGFQPSQNQPAPTGYILQIATQSAGPWTNAYSGPLLTASLTGLNPAQTYYVQVIPTNAGGNGAASPAAVFTTIPVTPGAPTGLTVTMVTSNSVSLSWTPPVNNGGGAINVYKVQTQQTDKLGTSLGIVVSVATASASPSYTVSGLSSGVSYTFFVTANNAAGSSPPSASIAQSTLGQAPKIVTYMASGPSTSTNAYSADVTLTIAFNVDTNQPDVSTTQALNNLFQFKPSIGSSYVGSWVDAKTLVIDIVNAGSASPTIGVAQVVVIGGIKTANDNSPASTSSSPALSGAFGSSGSLGGKVLVTKTDWIGETTEGTPTSLGVGIDLTPLFQDGTYQLVVSVISPLLPGSSLSGTGFSDPGLVLTTSGTPVTIQQNLDTLIYTPAPAYTGPVSFTFQLSNKVTGELLASLVTALGVKANAALPTVTAPDSVDVVLEQYSVVTGVQVGSTDANVANSLFVVYVSTSQTGSSMFSSATPGVSYTPAALSEAPSHELIGTLSGLNDALTKLQVKFTFSTNSAQRNYAPDPYTITVEIEDMSTAVTDDAQRNHAVRTISAVISCATAAVPATTITAALMDDNANGIIIKLDKPVSDAYLVTPVFECTSLFDQSSVDLFGDSPVCHWISTVTFRVELGMGAKFVPSVNQLTVKEGALQRCIGGSNSAPAKTFTVSAPAATTLPKVFISGPTTTSLCNTLVLQGITAMVGGRVPVFSWKLPRGLHPAFLPSKVDGPILEVDPMAFGDGGDFEFGLTVTNFLGQTSALYTRMIHATNMPVPLIFPTSVTEISTTSTQTVRIYNSITTNPCFNEPLKPMVFTWTLVPPLPVGSTVALNNANLVIPRNTLTPTLVYNATLKVAIATNPGLFTTLQYKLNLLPSPLHAVIGGGEWRKVRLDADGWSLDGSRSTDDDALSMASMLADFGRVTSRAANADGTEPTPITALSQSDYAPDKYEYSWKCTAQAGGACYSAIDGTPLLFTESEPILSFGPGALKAGQYNFELTFTHIPSGRSASTATLVSIREGVNPQPYGASGTVDILLDAMETIINPNGKLHLSASLPKYFNQRPDDLVYDWSVLGGGAVPFNLDDPVNVQGLGTSTLILNPHEVDAFFVPGTDYHFKVTVYHKDDLMASTDSGAASAYVRINTLPTCDSFVASPIESGIAFNTSFVVNAVSCYDPDTNDLLSYAFFRQDEQGNKFDLLPNSNSPLGRVPFFPTGAASNNYGLTVGVTISDALGGRQEYTKEVKVTPNSNLQSDETNQNVNGISVLKAMYTQTWAPNMAISGDSEMLLVIIAAIFTEVNELASSMALSAADLDELVEFKRSLLADVSNIAFILPSSQVLQTIYELLEDSKHSDLNLLGAALDFVSLRAKSEPGTSTDEELVEDYARVAKSSLDYIVSTTATGVVNTGGSRRLFSMDTSNMVVGKNFVTASTGASATPMSIVQATYNLLDILAMDASARSLILRGEIYPINLENVNGFSGAVGRGLQGSAVNVSTTDGYSIIVSPSAFADVAIGNFYDVSVFGTNPVPYIGLVSANEASTIVSGGANVNAFVPTVGKDSAPIGTFNSGDVEVEIPYNIALESCVHGDFVDHPNDNAAPGNVFGNICKLGCKVWNGGSFTDSSATIVAVHPISRKVVCGVTSPGVVVIYNTILTTPYVRPSDDEPAGEEPQAKFQPNGLPWGVVRASMLINPAPTIFDLNSFKGQIVQDLASVLVIPGSRIIVQQVSTTNGAATVIWDFTVPTTESTTPSQDLYDQLISLSSNDVSHTVYLKDVNIDEIAELCDDKEYRHVCNSSQSAWSKWELPVIIAVCCFVLVCCIGSVIFACIKCRRAGSGKMAPALPVADLAPAKKFVYTAPNSEANPEESLSEVTLRPQGQEFEPSHPTAVAGEEAGSKNRLSAKFPNKSPAGAASLSGEAAKEPSQSSHHFYYVDDSKNAAPTPSGARHVSRSGDSGGAHFTIEGSQSREISTSSSSVSSGSGGRPDSPVSGRRPSLEEEKDKAPLPVLRPSRSPKK